MNDGEFVKEIASKDEASKVIGALNNFEFMNRKLFVNPAKPLNQS